MNKNYSEKRIPRPPNAFMLFGQKYRRTVAQQYPTYTNKQISKILGDKWRKMDPAEKDSYHCLANEAHANHMKKYPGYYYSPLEARQRKAERKRKYMQKITLRRNNSDSNENVIDHPNITNTQFVQYNYNLMPTCCSSNPLDSLTISDPNGNDLNGYHGLFGDHCYAAFIEPDTSHHTHQSHPSQSTGPHHHSEFEQSQLQQQLHVYQPTSHLFDSQRPCQRSHGFPAHYIKEEPSTPTTPMLSTTPTPPTSTSTTPTITSANQHLCPLQLPDQHQQFQLQPQPDLLDFEALDKLIGNANLDNWNFLVDFKF